MRIEVKLAVVGLCCVALVVGGCGSRASRGDAQLQGQATQKARVEPVKRDPCSLVTKEEVEAALKTPIVQVVTDDNDCTYQPTEGTFKVAKISVEWEQAEAAMSGAKAGVKMMGLGEPVPGIGDEAVFMPPGVLYARKGGVFLTVSLFYADNALDNTKALAEKAFSRL